MISRVDTAVRTPLEVFNLPQHLVVPLFQRPYVWDEENQWQPLWQDIRRLAEHRASNPSSGATHFLGAIVLQALENQSGTLQPRSIIDGQQRLTTLQLLLDATSAIFESRGLDHLAGQLEGLTHNSSHFVQTDGDALKLRHTNRDRTAYDEVMEADPPVDYELLVHRGSQLVKAHRYFSSQVDDWLGTSEEAHSAMRAETLAVVLTRALQLVVIDLRSDEDSQEIFETLNARGTPLTAADLIKNFVFQRLTAEAVDTDKAYLNLWPFDTAFWEKEVSVGRYPISRSSLFLNQWLVSRVGEEIGPKSTFSRFKYYVEHESGKTMADLLPDIREQANRYQAWTERASDPNADLSDVELSVYRTQAAEIEALKPVLIWLHEPHNTFSRQTIDAVVRSTESWFMRRVLLRLSLGDLGRVVADLVKSHRDAPDHELAERVLKFLTRQNSQSTYWPGDSELRESLRRELAYRRFKRARLRIILEAVEDDLRGFNGAKPSLTGPRVPRVGYPIEHLLPQKWSSHWAVDDLAEEMNRDAHVHRLGNLTLLTSSLNSSISNGPWLGEKGKRARLEKHDVLLMNRRIRDASEAGWNELRIDERTETLIDAVIATWTVPTGHIGSVSQGAAGKDSGSATLRQLVAAGLVPPGTHLRSRPGVWGGARCEVLAGGDLALEGQIFKSPSAAGHHIRKGATNGWQFWELPDGRRLADVRAEFVAGAGLP